MTQEFVIRCQPDNPGSDAYVVRDASGEVEYYSNIDAAIAFAMDYQDHSKHASYTVHERPAQWRGGEPVW
jgi:hypothetical protein